MRFRLYSYAVRSCFTPSHIFDRTYFTQKVIGNVTACSQILEDVSTRATFVRFAIGSREADDSRKQTETSDRSRNCWFDKRISQWPFKSFRFCLEFLPGQLYWWFLISYIFRSLWNPTILLRHPILKRPFITVVPVLVWCSMFLGMSYLSLLQCGFP